MTETTTILEKAGIGGYEEYRIPAIAVTDKGTVLTAWESRKETGNDWAECHITVRRSTDDGKSFGEPQYIRNGSSGGADHMEQSGADFRRKPGASHFLPGL